MSSLRATLIGSPANNHTPALSATPLLSQANWILSIQTRRVNNLYIYIYFVGPWVPYHTSTVISMDFCGVNASVKIIHILWNKSKNDMLLVVWIEMKWTVKQRWMRPWHTAWWRELWESRDEVFMITAADLWQKCMDRSDLGHVFGKYV